MKDNEENDVWEVVSDKILLEKFKDKTMQNGLLALTWANVRGALVSGVITAVLGIAGYIIGVGDIYKLDLHTLANVGALSALTTIVSLIKNYLTSNQGNFLGTVNVSQPQ